MPFANGIPQRKKFSAGNLTSADYRTIAGFLKIFAEIIESEIENRPEFEPPTM